MSRRGRCVLAVLTVSLVVALPLGAAPKPGPAEASAFSRLVSVLWERLSAPLTFLRSADTTDSRGGLDPLGGASNATSPVTGDSRGGLDPLG